MENQSISVILTATATVSPSSIYDLISWDHSKQGHYGDKNFDEAAGVFTADETRKYSIQGNICFSYPSGQTIASQIFILVNGQFVCESFLGLPTSPSNNAAAQSVQISKDLLLSSGDKVSLRISNADPSNSISVLGSGLTWLSIKNI